MSCKPIRLAMATLLTAVSAMGQVDLRLDIENTTVLTHEPLMARVTVVNNGVEPLVVNAAGGAGPQLYFNVEHDSRGASARRQGKVLPPLTLQPGHAQVVEVDLTMHFVLTQSGRYFVRAKLGGGGVEARSSLKVIDMVPGMELVSVTGSIPRTPGVRRTYSLRHWSWKREKHVLLCVSDAPSGRVFAPIHLGTFISVVRPTLTVGADGMVTVKHQVNRFQMMVSTLKSLRDKVTLVSQRPVRITASAPPKAPASLPRE